MTELGRSFSAEMDTYCSSVNCANFVCHEGRTLCTECDPSFTEHCPCHCDCYTNITLMSFATRMIVNDLLSNRDSVHVPTKIDPAFFSSVGIPLQDLEVTMRNLNIEQIADLAQSMFKDNCYEQIRTSHNVMEAKIKLLLHYTNFAYISTKETSA